MEKNKFSLDEIEKKINNKECLVIDVREPDEFKSEHIRSALNIPLSSLEPKAFKNINPNGVCILMCKSGKRSKEAYNKLKSENPNITFSLLEGGIEAWKSGRKETVKSENQQLPVMRVVQITAGSLVFFSTILGILIHPVFFGISIFVGAGLTFAGLTGWCGMAILINKLRKDNSCKSKANSCSI